MSILASFTRLPTIQITPHSPASHWRALCEFPLGAMWSIGMEVLCYAFQILCCPSLILPLCLPIVNLVICARHGVICNRRSGMSPPSTMLWTVDVFHLAPTKAQRDLPAFWSTANSSSPSCHRNNLLHSMQCVLHMHDTAAFQQTADSHWSTDPN